MGKARPPRQYVCSQGRAVRKRRRGSIRGPEVARSQQLARLWAVGRVLLIGAGIAGVVLVMLFFGFPFIEDLLTGTDPRLRYEPSAVKSDSCLSNTENIMLLFMKMLRILNAISL